MTAEPFDDGWPGVFADDELCFPGWTSEQVKVLQLKSPKTKSMFLSELRRLSGGFCNYHMEISQVESLG
jgi:hypothetical protein